MGGMGRGVGWEHMEGWVGVGVVEEIVGEMGVHDVQPGQGGRCVQGNGS